MGRRSQLHTFTMLMLAALAVSPGCGDVPADAEVRVERQELIAEILPGACLVGGVPVIDTFACWKGIVSDVSSAWGSISSILTFLGAVDSGPSMGEQLAQLSLQIEQVKKAVQLLQTQVKDLTVTVTEFHSQDMKVVVATVLDRLANLQNNIVLYRATQDPVILMQILDTTHVVAETLQDPAFYDDVPSPWYAQWHTPMYAGMAFAEAVMAYSMAIAATIPFGTWTSTGWSFKADLNRYSARLRVISGYAREWAMANVTLHVVSWMDETYSITRRCPVTSYALYCGTYTCRCRFPTWLRAYNGRANGVYRQNLANGCVAPSQPRVANPCVIYPAYNALLVQGQTEFVDDVGTQYYLDTADRVDQFNAANY